MALYEVVLRFQDREEVRLTDRPLEVGHTVRIEGAQWLVERRERQRGAKAARYICVEPRTLTHKLRARSSVLMSPSHDIGPPRPAEGA